MTSSVVTGIKTVSSQREEGLASQSVPADWPAAGPIDLDIHDLPHASSTLEWWYVNTHMTTQSGQSLSIFAAFFRQLQAPCAAGSIPQYAYSVTWAVSIPKEKRYHAQAAVDSAAATIGLAKLDAGAGSDDPRINRAMREVFAKNRIPGPTRTFSSGQVESEGRLAIAYGSDHFEKEADGTYRLHLDDEANQIGCDLVLRPRKPPTRYGNDGVVHGVGQELMFYYFIPRCEVAGTVVIDGKRDEVIQATGWYDHEFGFIPELKRLDAIAKPPDVPPTAKRALTSWRWISAQLDSGADVSVFLINDTVTGRVLDNWTIISDAAGARFEYSDARVDTLETWRSTRSFIEYPTRFVLHVPTANLRLVIGASFPDQEVVTIISDPAFWEGRVDITGDMNGRATTGRGWVECKGYRFHDLDAFFAAVGTEVRSQIASVLALDPTAEQVQNLLVRGHGSDESVARYAEGLDTTQLVATLVKPIRDIADRGGKSWRSYAALASVDIVGGDSRRFLHWLAMPELLHVGSLIVDDVEDESDVRRGGPSCHRIHGQAHAINAGTAAYFLAEPRLFEEDLPAQAKVRIYRLFFDAMRAAHAGQAIDISGLRTQAAEAAATGDIRKLQQSVLAIHRLKTGVPAGMLAKIGGVLGGGTDAQIDALGSFFESTGLAFQIIDDVLNLRGFKGHLKERGEDVRHGKVTMPVVKALGMMPDADRFWLWNTLSQKPQDARIVSEVIDRIESVGAVTQCVSEAQSLVEAAWCNLDPLVEDSQVKVMFRAFGWYVLERHY